MKRLFLILMTLTITMLFISCKDNKLTREKAKELIEPKFHQKVYSYIPYGQMDGYGCADATKNYAFDRDCFLNSHNDIKDLVNANLITLEEFGYTGFAGSMSLQVSIKPEYSKYKMQEFNKGKNCVVEMGEKVFIDITGIREFEDGKSADVEYTWKFSNSTPFSKVLNYYYDFNIVNGYQNNGGISGHKYNDSQISNARVHIVKYDDGWRLENFRSPDIVY